MGILTFSKNAQDWVRTNPNGKDLIRIDFLKG
jgi:hypothetical protein